MASTTHSSNSTSKFADGIALERRHSTNSVDSDPVGVYFVRQKPSLCIEYGTDLKQHGPHDTTRHSRWPVFLRIRGSVVPAMILPLTFITLWSTCITCISQFIYPKSKCFISAVPMFPSRPAGLPRHMSTPTTAASNAITLSSFLNGKHQSSTSMSSNTITTTIGIHTGPDQLTLVSNA